MEIQKALAEALSKYGQVDYKGRLVASVSLHHDDIELSAATLAVLNSLPYAADDTGEIKYATRKVDQVRNLQIWK